MNNYLESLRLFVSAGLKISEPLLIDAVCTELGNKYDTLYIKKISAKKYGIYTKKNGKCIGIYDSIEDAQRRYAYEIDNNIRADLSVCPNCKEKSVATKVWTDKTGKKRRVTFCINKGCGYKREFPFPEDFEEKTAINKVSYDYDYNFYTMTKSNLEKYIEEVKQVLRNTQDWNTKTEIQKNLRKALQVYQSAYGPAERYAKVISAFNVGDMVSTEAYDEISNVKHVQEYTIKSIDKDWAILKDRSGRQIMVNPKYLTEQYKKAQTKIAFKVGDKVKSINKNIEGEIIGYEQLLCPNCNEVMETEDGHLYDCPKDKTHIARQDVDFRIKWDKPIDGESLMTSEVHPTEIELVEKKSAKQASLTLDDINNIKELYRTTIVGNDDVPIADISEKAKNAIIDYTEELIAEQEFEEDDPFDKHRRKFWDDVEEKISKLKQSSSPRDILLSIDYLISTFHVEGQYLDWAIRDAEDSGRGSKYLIELENTIHEIYDLAEQLKKADYSMVQQYHTKEEALKQALTWSSSASRYWIDPDGNVIDVSETGLSHHVWAKNWLAKYYESKGQEWLDAEKDSWAWGVPTLLDMGWTRVIIDDEFDGKILNAMTSRDVLNDNAIMPIYSLVKQRNVDYVLVDSLHNPSNFEKYTTEDFVEKYSGLQLGKKEATESVKQEEYLVGTCINSFNDEGICVKNELPYQDVTDFAQDEENNFAMAKRRGIDVVYDEKKDIHYFYKEESLNRVGEDFTKEIPDVNNADKMIKWIDSGNQKIYLEGFCDECLSGTGFPTIEGGETENKINYIRDLADEIAQRKAKERGLKLTSTEFIETPDASNLYGVLVAKFGNLKIAIGEFKFDPNSTENEGRWRLLDPKILTDYFRRKSSTPGISYVMGKDNDGKDRIQAIRFDKSVWDEKSASEWWDKNKDKYERIWTQKDWDKIEKETGNITEKQ